METVIVILIVGAAAWYVFRQFAAVFKQEKSGCGCGDCGGCPSKPLEEIGDLRTGKSSGSSVTDQERAE